MERLRQVGAAGCVQGGATGVQGGEASMGGRGLAPGLRRCVRVCEAWLEQERQKREEVKGAWHLGVMAQGGREHSAWCKELWVTGSMPHAWLVR